jgi:hypothetical protein
MSVAEAVDSGDLDRVIRLVDGLCSSRDWDAVVEARDRCRFVIERGLQMWPAAEYAEYRLALEAPARYAGAVVVDAAGRFALGPLWEVAASTHAWGELADHILPGPARTLAAHERVLRGEDLGGDDRIDRELLDLPLTLLPWEPAYEVAEYLASEARFPAPSLPRLAPTELEPGGEPSVDEASEALLSLAAPWAERSNGTVRAAAVNGTVEAAIATLGHSRALTAEVDAAVAMSLMAWAGSSGGAYGRRRGSPMGRFAAWWAAAATAGVEWPPDPGTLGESVSRLRWVAWEPVGVKPGWSASLAVEDPSTGRAWALLALDSHREEDEEVATRPHSM